MPSSPENTWWWNTYLAKEEDLSRFFNRHLPGESEDLVQEVGVSLLDRLSRPSMNLPESWFGTGTPQRIEAYAFYSLLWDVARARLYDSLRRRYVLSRIPVGELQPRPPSVPNGPDPQEVLKLLAKQIDALPQEDRELLMHSISTARGERPPMTPAERTRLHRLRRELAEKVWKLLKREG